MRKYFSFFAPQKYISIFLIFCLLVSQTIRVDFFDIARASPENYHDIVSVIVDKKTYGSLTSEIKRYVTDIGGYLGNTRVSLIVVDEGTPPEVIAARNERLYLEGDGESGVSKLVGTILIGNIPLPMVSYDGTSFPSVYPYVDFVDKKFVYNSNTLRYENSVDGLVQNPSAEVWHGVINPAVGRSWEGDNDIIKLRNFFEKTHSFYTRSGKFSPSNIPPRVFYYDGYNESRSVDMRSLFQYALSMKNSENIAYKRFTKYLLKDINATLLQFDSANADPTETSLLTSLGVSTGQNGFDDATISSMPDIQTKEPIMNFLKDFKSIINEKTLGDINLFVHNAGRYNSGSTVRADISAISMTLMDIVARSTIKEANTALQNSIDKTLIDGKMIKKIPLFDYIESSYAVPISSATGSLKTYYNYILGNKTEVISSANQCTLARGSSSGSSDFGKGVLVEANVGYDVTTAMAHAERLKRDTEELIALQRSNSYACFDIGTGKAKLNSYWGGNSILRVSGSDTSDSVLSQPPGGTSLKGFSESIFSLGGMKETTRFPVASVGDCMNTNNQYLLRPPYKYTYTYDYGEGSSYSCTTGFPKEWTKSSGLCQNDIANRIPKYSCLTEHEVVNDIPSFSQAVADYNSRTCYAGDLVLDGAKIKTANRTCITTMGGGGDGGTSEVVDTTTYENKRFHTISGFIRHISPTDDELSAASNNGVTPSLPVDLQRYIEFITPKGNIVKLSYPNLFEAPIDSINSVRTWLTNISNSEWKNILDKENSVTVSPLEVSANAFLDVGSLPTTPVDWNNYISDDLITQVIQARNWLNPDVTTKYKKAIETTLSYSHEYISGSLLNPPKIPNPASSYEIAYLGLTPFIPNSENNADISSTKNEYDTRLAEIQGFNFSDPYDPQSQVGSSNAKCGPIDGVDLFQWPNALMCWLDSLKSLNLFKPGSCGPSTIGFDNSSTLPISSPSLNSNSGEVVSFYTSGSLIWNFPRISLTKNDTIEGVFSYVKNGNILTLPSGTTIEIKLISGTTKDGSSIAPSLLSSYISPIVQNIPVSSPRTTVGLSSYEKLGSVSVKAVMKIPLPNGQVYEAVSKEIPFVITDEYIGLQFIQADTPIYSLDVTKNLPVRLSGTIQNSSGAMGSPKYPLSLDIYDDISSGLLGSGIVLTSSGDTLPKKFLQTVGVYKFIVSDAGGRMGESTLSVVSGPLSKITFEPISSQVLKGSSTLAFINLKDASGNPISPDLHSIDIEVSGGYIIDAAGQKLTKMHIDATESSIPLLFGSDETGDMKVRITSDGVVSTEGGLSVLNSARLILSRVNTPVVGSDPVRMTIRVVDRDGNILSGFNSLAFLSLPENAGYFDTEKISIRNGKSEGFLFIPGTEAGTHFISATVPGIGDIKDIPFTIDPGPSMYMTHRELDNTIEFNLRDRFGNKTNENFQTTVRFNNENAWSTNFSSGSLVLPKKGGYYLVITPDISKNTISYTDENGPHSISGIEKYVAFIKSSREKFDFLSDYNARYTVLAGDSYLREAEDILYNTLPNNSQSLAVTTLLDTPYAEETLFRISPNGGYTVGLSETTQIETSISLANGIPTLSVSDIVGHTLIGKFSYSLQNASLSVCTNTPNSVSDDCFKEKKSNSLKVILPNSSYSGSISNGVITISSDSREVFHVNSDGRISVTRSGISLVANNDASKDAFVLDVKAGNDILASIMYVMDKNVSLQKDSAKDASAIVFDSKTGMTPVRFSDGILASDVYGYIFYGTSTQKSFDEKKNGPNTIDSFGAIDNIPGVGWQGKNRTLLSYSAGDTVGEATKWFHTYTMVNLGDPVAHVDSDAVGVQKDGIDRTIGQQITSPGTSVASYSLKDMNADGYDDIIVLDTAGYVSLFLGNAGTFREKEKIAYLPSAINHALSFGNFTGDGYSDMFSLNSSGSFVFLSNDRRHFASTDIRAQTGASVPSGITDIRIYDMNADKRDDIVYLTEDGELGILYGTPSHGVFEKNILDTTLGVYLSPDSTPIGGALRTADVRNIPLNAVGTTASSSETLDTTILNSEVYYQYNHPRDIVPVSSYDSSTLSGVLSATPESSSEGNQSDTYIKSEYAESVGVRIKRNFSPIISSRPLHAGDTVRATISFENISGKTIRNTEYLDTIPTLFDYEDTKVYTLTVDGNSREIPFSYLSSDDYDAYFSLGDIPAGKTVSLSYDVKSLPAKYGELIVGNLEKGEVGDDIYGDVGFNGSNSCGADMVLWRSESEKGYKRGTRTFSKPAVPTDIASYTNDADKNGIPDRIDSMTLDQQKDLYNKKLSASPSTPVVRVNTNGDGKSLSIGFDPTTEKELSTIAENLASGLSCGFGGGGCMSFPMNWAPLAPGSAPVVFGYPLSSLVPSTGTPIFSALTCQLITFTCGTAPCTMGIPLVYPASKMGANNYGVVGGANNGAACGNITQSDGAGGRFGVDSRMNFLRIYATPTLTLGYGTAICFGATARTYGNNPGKGVWPLTQGGNCIVMTGSLPMCKEDGSKEDGDVTGFSGLGSTTDAWNAGSCSMNNQVLTKDEDISLTNDIVAYLKDPKTRQLNQIYSRLSARGPRTVNLGPLIRMGSASSGGSQVGIEIDSAKPISTGNIVKVKNKRVSGFPDFIMDWVQRQGDEAVTALFTPPTLTVIPPTTLGPNSPFDGIDSFLDKFKESSVKQGVENLKSQMGTAYDKGSSAATSSIQKKTLDSRTQTTWGGSSAVKGAQGDYEKWLDNSVLGNENVSSAVNAGGGALSSARAAYTFVSKIPFFSIQKTRVPINVPWILPQELDRYTRALESYKREYDTMMKDFCKDKTPEQCADAKTSFNAGGFLSSLDQNIKRINDWKNFPTKLQKYITWKQRYINQLLCYINTIQQVSGGWLKSNGVRFRKWAELVVLMRAIADGWQPFIDIFKNTNAQCGVCRNERYNAQYFKFKLLSAIIPSAPIIRFPRWPNIILNLSDIRMAINIKVPDFQFNLTPIRLPSLPNLTLPRSPKAGLALPALALIPAIPPLPELPDLPSIPSFKLPDLPPPPKLPKIFGSVSAMLNIMKLISKLYCYYQKTSLVPEWNVGDVIAQRTERKGTSPMDFLNLQLPQFSVPTVKAIKVATHINAQVRSDFIAEYAKNAVKPVNSLSTDFQNILPKKIGEDINIGTPAPNINIKIQSDGSTKVQSYERIDTENFLSTLLEDSFRILESEKDVMVDTDEFKELLHSEYKRLGLSSTLGVKLNKSIEKTKLEEQNLTHLLLQENNEKFELLRAYFEAEYKETSELQQKVDLLQKSESFLAHGDDIRHELVADTQTESHSDKLLREYTTRFSSIPNISDTSYPEQVITKKHLAFDPGTTPSSSPSPSNSTSSYSPNFQGIYILTPSGEQTRLFDYIDPLTGDETVQSVDIDKDGDNDYIFILDGTLYIKSSHTKEPQKNKDSTIIQKDIGPNDEKPTAPNYFRENVNTPSSLNITFASALASETEWRMSFYDRYTEWDALSLGSHNIADTPLRIVDLMAGKTLSQIVNPVINRVPVLRSLERVSDKNDFTILGPKFITLTGAVDFTLSPGRTLYTGNDKIRINYNGSSQSGSIILEPHSGYKFNEIVRISQESGTSYVLWDNTSSVYYEYSDTMIGMPLLPGVKISSKDASFRVYDYTHNESIDVPSGTEYFIEYLGDKASVYNFDMSYPNGYYSARIQNLTDRKDVLAAVSLLAPLASSDVSAPVVDFPDTINIPVYQKKTLPIKDFVFDTNPYTVSIDSDTSLDENNNGVYDDDFGQISTGATIENNSISFGPFDSLSKKQMILRVQDIYGNITLKNLTVSVYSPLPQILSVSGTGWLKGAIMDEKLLSEPVHLFRVRTGQDISLLSSGATLTDLNGYFMSGSYFTLSGVSVSSRSGSFILSEKGIPKTLPIGYDGTVSFANPLEPMMLHIRDTVGRDIYTQMFSLPKDTKIQTLSSRDENPNLSSIGIFTEKGYKAIPASLSDPNIPLGMYIVSEEDNHSMALLSRDGNIYQAYSGTTLNLSPGSGEYPVFTLYKDGKKVTTFFYKFDFFYTNK